MRFRKGIQEFGYLRGPQVASVADQVLAIAAILDAYAARDLSPDLARRAIMAEIEAIL